MPANNFWANEQNINTSQTTASYEKCNQEDKPQLLSVRGWHGSEVKVFWSDHAPPSCFGPGFPRIQINDPSIQAFIQVVEVNIPPESSKEWGQNLNEKGESNWIFLDVSPEARKKKWPFYNLNFASRFHDNPAWGPISSESTLNIRKWKGRLYGLARDSAGRCKPRWGLTWGFSQSKNVNVVTPLAPQGLDFKSWENDFKRIKKLGPHSCL